MNIGSRPSRPHFETKKLEAAARHINNAANTLWSATTNIPI